IVVENHVHASQPARRAVLLLSIKRELGVRFVGHFQEQRTGTARGIVNSRAGRGLRGADAKNLSNDATDLCRSVELSFALAALGGEVPHQVFVGIAKDVVTVGTVL